MRMMGMRNLSARGKKGIIDPDKWEMDNSLVDSTEPYEQLS